MEISVVEVNTDRELKQFITFPRKLYQSDKNFVFEPVSMQKEFLSKRNPFFEHSGVTYFLAKLNGKVVGRIASIKNTIHNKLYQEKTGFFGLFESIENYEVAKLLFDKVLETHQLNGFYKIIGPTNLTTNDSCGILISGFDIPPVVMMPYNKQYYDDFLVKYGFVKEIDLFSYFIGDQLLTSSFMEALFNRISNKLTTLDITIRTINYKRLDQEISPLCEVYNQSNKNNWGFVPLNEKEFRNTALQLKQFVPEKLVLIVEKEKQQIGFIVALPELNQVFSHIRSGKLLPFGFLKFLWYKRKINNSRILILGVLEKYRNNGIDLVLYKKIQENLATIGIYQGEACYDLENNLMMNSIMERIGGRRLKRYRIYKLEKQALKMNT